MGDIFVCLSDLFSYFVDVSYYAYMWFGYCIYSVEFSAILVLIFYVSAVMVSNLFSSFDPRVGVSYRLFPLWF